MRSNADFGQAIVFIADKARLSQKKLARALELTPQAVSAWNTGKRGPNPGAMKKLPEILGCTPPGAGR
jgi:DNA-binding transcriptional regulator YiaG